MTEQFCKIVRLMEQHISADPLIVDGERISQYPTGIDAAAEGIEKMYNDMNCGNCKHYCFSEEHQHLFCLKHDCLLFNAHILKCNQWEAKQ